MKTYQIKVLSLPTKRGSTSELLDFVISSESSLKEVYDHYAEKYKPLGVHAKEVPVLTLNITKESKEEVQDSSVAKVFKNKIICDLGRTIFETYRATERECELSNVKFHDSLQEVRNAIKDKFPGVISVGNINSHYGNFEAEILYKPEEVLTLKEAGLTD